MITAFTLLLDMDGKLGAMENPAESWMDHAVVFAAHVATLLLDCRQIICTQYIQYIYIYTVCEDIRLQRYSSIQQRLSLLQVPIKMLFYPTRILLLPI